MIFASSLTYQLFAYLNYAAHGRVIAAAETVILAVLLVATHLIAVSANSLVFISNSNQY
jgi:hypothetical protein